MQIIPAIDMLDGKIVRLKQGDFERRTEFPGDPLALAKAYEASGASRLHLVDLSGARSGDSSPEFLDLVERISTRTSLSLQVGGGLNSKRARELLQKGVQKIVIGSLFFEPQFEELLESAGPARIIIALDVLDGTVRTRGWQRDTGVSLDDALSLVMKSNIRTVLMTSIERDGMNTGPDLDLYAGVKKNFPELSIIASGGIRNLADIDVLRSVCDAVVVGRALLDGAIASASLASR